jgi:hypothetical protein
MGRVLMNHVGGRHADDRANGLGDNSIWRQGSVVYERRSGGWDDGGDWGCWYVLNRMSYSRVFEANGCLGMKGTSAPYSPYKHFSSRRFLRWWEAVVACYLLLRLRLRVVLREMRGKGM